MNVGRVIIGRAPFAAWREAKMHYVTFGLGGLAQLEAQLEANGSQ
jgi:hypothetical protein